MKKYWWGIFFGSLIGVLLLSPDSNFSHRIRDLFYSFQDGVISLIDLLSQYITQPLVFLIFILSLTTLGIIINQAIDGLFPSEIAARASKTAKPSSEDVADKGQVSTEESDKALTQRTATIRDTLTSRFDERIKTLRSRGEFYGKVGFGLAFAYILYLVRNFFMSDYSDALIFDDGGIHGNLPAILLASFVPAFSLYLIKLYWNSLREISVLDQRLCQLEADYLMFEVLTLSDPESRRQMVQAYIDNYQRFQG